MSLHSPTIPVRVFCVPVLSLAAQGMGEQVLQSKLGLLDREKSEGKARRPEEGEGRELAVL